MQDASDPERRPGLSRRETQVYDELHRLDPRLAGLFRQGLDYIHQLEEPGTIHMLSHAGREISNAVLRILSGEGVPIAADEGGKENECTRKDESQRGRIARLLDLPEHHPTVTTWFKAHQALLDTTHVGSSTPSPDRVDESVRAFRALTDILFGRIGLYFDARREVEELLGVKKPSEEQIERLQALTGRPQLRHAFFRELRHLGWLEPLAAAGFFEEPPDVRTDPDTGQLTAPPWPEGDYLGRVASDASEKVVEILRSLPDGVRNPIVWRGIAEAAMRLPSGHARLVPKLCTGLEQIAHPMVSRGAFAVAEKLASAHDGHALELLRALLRVASSEDRSRLSTSDTGRIADLPNMRHTVRPDALFSLVETIASVRARATVAALVDVLRRMLEIEYGDPAGKEAPVADHSAYWHRHGEDVDERSPKSLLAAAILRAAVVVAESVEAGDAYVLDRLSRHPWKVFLRLRLAFLAQRPVFDQGALDAALGDPAHLNPPQVLPEYRQLLQIHFDEASPTVRKSIVRQILGGPDEEPVACTGEDEAAQTSIRERWQRHRLRIFGDTPPPELLELATALGTIGESLTKFERDLDEYGFAVGAGVGGGPRSPLTADEVREMGPEGLLDYLRIWEPEGGLDTPTPAGLASVIAGQIEEDAAWGADFLERSRDSGIDATYLRGAVDGLAGALRAGLGIPWREALEFVEWLLSRPTEPPAERSAAHYLDYRDPGLAWARTAAADLLRDAARHDLVPEEHREELWNAVGALIRTEATWVSSDDAPGSMDGVLHVELNHLSGKAAEALLNVALHDYRAWQQSEPSAEEWPSRARLRPLLDIILEQRGTSGIAARSALGRYLPQLVLIDAQWHEANWGRLFDGAVEEPFRNPTFANYIVSSSLYREVVEVLLPLYEEAIAATARAKNPWTSGEESFRPGRHLLTHLLVAYRRGWLELEADGKLLDAAFTNANLEDTSHVWWEIFRYWSDADGVSSDDAERVAKLWEWRLGRLEELRRDEGRRGEEAKGLAWLAMADPISDADVLPLLLRGVRLSRGEVPIAGALWERLVRMTAVDIGQALETAELIIRAELRADFPHFNFAEVTPILRAGLASDDLETRKLTARTIHLLGDRGFEQFGQLLQGE